jgi:hypothetical protein
MGVPDMRNEDWILTFNWLDSKDMGMVSVNLKKFPVRFQLFDDDGILYFTGYMTKKLEDSPNVLDPLDYAMDAWGCTEMKINGKTI